MDEQTIATKVAQNIKTEVHVPAPETKPEPQLNAFETNVELNDPAISMQIADYFGLSSTDRFNSEVQGQLRALYRWGAERAGTMDRADVLQQLSLLERELGVSYKPERLSTMSRWVKLDKQADAIRKEKEVLGGPV
jgi:hypothetical protein